MTWDGKRNDHIINKYKWPRSVKPSVRALADWRTFLQEVILQYSSEDRLRYKVNENIIKSKRWRYLYYMVNNRLYVYDNDKWEVWTKRITRTRTQIFTRSNYHEDQITGYPCMVKRYANRIYVKEIGNTLVRAIGKTQPEERVIKYNTELSLIKNLDRCKEDVKWCVNKVQLEGNQEDIITNFINGSIKIVTDGSYIPGGEIAKAAITSHLQVLNLIAIQQPYVFFYTHIVLWPLNF